MTSLAAEPWTEQMLYNCMVGDGLMVLVVILKDQGVIPF